MPTRKQMDLMAASIGRKVPDTSGATGRQPAARMLAGAARRSARRWHRSGLAYPGSAHLQSPWAVELKQYARKLRRQMEADDKGRAH